MPLAIHPTYQKFSVRVARSRIDGFGVFAREPVPARRKIGEIRGESISLAEARRRQRSADFGSGSAASCRTVRVRSRIRSRQGASGRSDLPGASPDPG